MPLDMILKLLKEEFERMEKLFDDKDWKFFKFGQGGPYKRTLTHLQEKAHKYDQIIFDHFGAIEETASFNKLIILCISAAKDSKERYDNIDTFKRQIIRMRKII
jgi:hypothetical protein